MNFSQIKTKYVKKPYDQIAKVYNRKHFDEKAFDPIINEFAKLLKPGAKVLDLGCGPGGETKKLLQHGFDVTSIDISPKMLSLAKKNVPNGRFLEMDITKMTFPKKTFDAVWTARTLIHLPSSKLDKVLASLNTILIDQGPVCVIVIEGQSEGLQNEPYDPSGKTKTYFHFFKDHELDQLFINHGFAIIKSKRFSLSQYQETYLVIFARKTASSLLDKKC